MDLILKKMYSLMKMQLYAVDKQKLLIPASKAFRKLDYFCIECSGQVRLRSGPHRRPHFFHVKPNLECHLSAKSLAHLQVQCRLQAILPEDACRLEVRFKEIGRIADAVWTDQKLIFEVQCSPISAEEVFQRNKDYGSLGFQVIWIFHDRQYNKFRISAAESSLKNSPHYFTNIDAEGRGIIYDQFDIGKNGLRLKKLPPLKVDLSTPLSYNRDLDEPGKIPQLAVQRIGSWPIGFAGDLADCSLKEAENDPYLRQALELEKSYFPSPLPKTFWNTLKSLFYRYGARPYRLAFQMLLERACR